MAGMASTQPSAAVDCLVSCSASCHTEQRDSQRNSELTPKGTPNEAVNVSVLLRFDNVIGNDRYVMYSLMIHCYNSSSSQWCPTPFICL